MSRRPLRAAIATSSRTGGKGGSSPSAQADRDRKPRRKRRLPRWLRLRLMAEKRLLLEARRMDSEVRRMAREG